jgi:hypothetical protein
VQLAVAIDPKNFLGRCRSRLAGAVWSGGHLHEPAGSAGSSAKHSSRWAARPDIGT